jgi:hypothetical protein
MSTVRRMISVSVCATAFCMAFMAGSCDNGNGPAAAFALTYPEGGETFYVGDAVTVTWTLTSDIAGIVIAVSKDGGKSPYNPIIEGQVDAPATSYTWVIPDTMVSTACKMRIWAYNDPQNRSETASTFTIATQ